MYWSSVAKHFSSAPSKIESKSKWSNYGCEVMCVCVYVMCVAMDVK